MSRRIYLTIAEVLAIHKKQIEEYGGILGIRDRALLESAVFRPQIAYYSSVIEEAGALMESLAINQPFADGNNPIAFAAAHTFLVLNGFDLSIEPASAFDFIMRSLTRGDFHFSKIIKWMNDHITRA